MGEAGTFSIMDQGGVRLLASFFGQLRFLFETLATHALDFDGTPWRSSATDSRQWDTIISDSTVEPNACDTISNIHISR